MGRVRTQRAVLTAALALAFSCGVLLAGPAAPAAPGTDPTDHRASPPGGDVRNEPSVAVDPRDSQHLAVAANDYDSTTIGVYVSRDGGLSWLRHDPPGMPRTEFGADPHLVYTPGRLFAAYLSYARSSDEGGLVVSRFDERQARWQLSVVRRNGVHQDGRCVFADFPALAVDRRGAQRVLYVAWQELVYADADCTRYVEHPIYLSRSSDGGRTWSPPGVVRQGTTVRTPYLPSLAVGPRGEVYVTYDESGPPPRPAGCTADLVEGVTVHVARAVDGGRTFVDRVVQVACYPNPPFLGIVTLPTGGYPASLTGATYRLPASSNTVVDPRTGHLVSVVGGADPVTLEQVAQVRVSADHGLTWRPGGTVPRLPGENQEYPRLAVGRDGRVSLLWLAQLPGGLLQASHAWSLDGGRNWQPVLRVATVPSRILNPLWLGFIGDYLGNDVGPDGRAHPVWTDLREVQSLNGGTVYTRAVAP
jgi:hypothetical protein